MKSTVSTSAMVVPASAISKTARACPRLHVGGKYFVDGKAYVFQRHLDEGQYLFKCDRELPLRVDPYDPRSALPDSTWISEMLAAGRFTHKAPGAKVAKSNRRMMCEAEAREVDPASVIRYNILIEIDKNGPRPDDVSISVAIDKIAGLYPVEAAFFKPKPTVKTVRTWLSLRGSYGDRAWADCVSMTGRSRTPRLPKEVRAAVVDAALHYWSDITINFWRAYNRLEDVISRRNAQAELDRDADMLELPSFSTFLRYVDYLATPDSLRMKFGDSEAKSLSAVGKFVETHRILESVQADHTVVDVIAIDEETGAEVGRPILTTIIDVKSRCILAFFISFDPASLGSIVECLKRCLRPKIGCAGSEAFPILQDIYGLPTLLTLDNAMEFVGVGMQDAMNDMGVILLFPPVKTPWAKPFVERLFGTLNTKLFHSLRGTTFNRATQGKRGKDYKPKGAITLNALQELIEHTCYAYHISPHSGLGGRPPALVWQEDAIRYGLPVLLDLDRLDALLACSARRVLSTDGVQLFDLMFNHAPTTSSVLAQLRADTKFDAREKRKVKYNPYDLSSIWLYNPVTRDYFVLPCVDQDYACGLSVFQHKKIQEHMVQAGLKFSSVEHRRQAWSELNAKIYDLTPGLLHKQKRALMRLRKTKTITSQIEQLGLTTTTGIPVLPHEPLTARTSDDGELPRGALRGAAKAKATKAKSAARKRRLAQSDEGHIVNGDWQEEDCEFDLEDEWKGYDDE